jgi:hypothetical protein
MDISIMLQIWISPGKVNIEGLSACVRLIEVGANYRFIIGHIYEKKN